MRVIASQRGYFNGIREPGDEFEVPEGTTGKWFDPVESEKPKGKSKPAKPADVEADDLA